MILLDPRSLARSALRWDAAFCALVGASAFMFAAPLGDHLGVAPWLVVIAAFGVIGWAGMVWGMTRGDGWWGPTATVAGVNLAAFVVLIAWALGTSGPGGAVLGLTAILVLGFVAIQVATLVRGWSDRIG